MIRVLLVYYEPIPAGQTTHVLALARRLDRRRFEPVVVLPDDLERPIAAFRDAGVETVPLPLRKVRWRPAAIRSFVRLVRRGAFDVVHVHSQEAGLVARPLARWAGARSVVYTPQVIDIRRQRWQWLYVAVERALAHLTDRLISVSELDRKRMIDWGIPARKIVAIPNGIDLGAFDDLPGPLQARRELGVAPGRPLVMQVGRLSAQKDPWTFVEGAALALRARPDIQFVLVGEGPLEAELERVIADRGLGENVRLLGWHEDAFRLMAAADVVTLTSRWEGMPHTLLEAMACARPVVTTGVNGSPEIVEDGVTGYLVPPGDPRAWAGRVLDVIEHPTRAARMGRAGRRRVERDFSLRVVVPRIERLYSQLVSSRSSKNPL